MLHEEKCFEMGSTRDVTCVMKDFSGLGRYVLYLRVAMSSVAFESRRGKLDFSLQNV